MTFDELGENFGIGTTTAWTTVGRYVQLYIGDVA